LTYSDILLWIKLCKLNQSLHSATQMADRGPSFGPLDDEGRVSSAVVYLRGCERGTCLRTPLSWGHPWGVKRIHFPYLWWKTYYSPILRTTKQII